MSELRVPRASEPDLTARETSMLLLAENALGRHMEYREPIGTPVVGVTAEEHDGYTVGMCLGCKRPVISSRKVCALVCGREKCDK